MDFKTLDKIETEKILHKNLHKNKRANILKSRRKQEKTIVYLV